MLGESESRGGGDAVVGSIAVAGRAGPAKREPGSISCIVCAYNEADRIRHILTAVRGHPAAVEQHQRR